MATPKSSVPVLTLPRELLEQRIEAQRNRIFRAAAIVSCARAALPRDVQAGDPDVIHALDEVQELLYRIAGQLETVLEDPISEDEREALDLDEGAPAMLMPSSAEVQ
jgi:hypothetical protein